MKQDRMTTLIHKIRREKSFQFEPELLMSLIEDISPTSMRRLLKIFFNYFRPHTAGMGLRVARLSDEGCEIVIPLIPHNLTTSKCLDPSVLLSAANLGAELFWARHFGAHVHILTRSYKFEFFKKPVSQLRMRFALPLQQKEVYLAELRENNLCEAEMHSKFFDEQEHLIAELQGIFSIESSQSSLLGTVNKRN